ncbi:MAG: tRNA (N(6)-L-threonylcarbamoyladenosine(37)-C(2))-methylthiotransferase MtaB [Dehalococcoidia bacterium]|nr:tRNA (N(6)-L-threonylcarbamoyladenosine(37)-C(2))-methylthiotransferase MtaB [Dehalococcoidia bacterium]
MEKYPGHRVALHAVGCKLNQAELETLALQFTARGFQVVGPRDEADVYVMNTCTITAEADRKVRQWLRSARRHNPGAVTVAVGCYVQRQGSALSPLADILVDNHGKDGIVDAVVEHLREGGGVADGMNHGPDMQVVSYGRTRSFVKVQDGCATPCAYCIVPMVRVGESSVPVEKVVEIVRQRVLSGHKEIVLTGTKIGVYQDGQTTLAGLVRRVLEVLGVVRLRLSSLQPAEITVELLSLWQDSRLCPHFHMSLQSGSATVLRRMRRRYSQEEFLRSMETIRKAVPHVAITTDVIVGFPGESEAEFLETVAFCEAAGFSRIHVFPYSPRPGTAAAVMTDRLTPEEMKARVRRMGEVASRSLDRYVDSCVGRTVQVLWEEETKPGSHVYSGTTDNYVHVLCESTLPLHNVVEDVTLFRGNGGAVWARRTCEDKGGCEAEREGSTHRAR